MADPKELENKLNQLLDDFKKYMEESGIESIKLEFSPGDPEPRPEQIQRASKIQIIEIKEKPEQKG